MYTINKTKVGDYILSIMVLCQYLLIMFQLCLIYILHLSPESTTSYRVILSVIPVLLSIPFIIRRELMLTLIIYIFAFLIMFFHSVLFPENATYIYERGFRFLVPICIPCLLGFCAIRDISIFKRCAIIISWTIIILLLWFLYIYIRGTNEFKFYNMNFGYILLFPTLILYKEKRLFPLIASIISFIAIISFGSRGPILVIMAYLGYDIFMNHRKHFFLYVAIIIGISFILIPWLFELLESIGIRSRTFTMLINGRIGNLTGRGRIYDVIMHAILNKPILGYGIYGDRPLLYILYRNLYCHNLLLELMIDWGVLLTIILLIYFVFKFIYIYNHINYNDKYIFMIFVILGIVPLLMSGSYLESFEFFSMIGMMIYFSRKIKMENIRELLKN